ncbi:LapA family protein [Shivajiella indica]|uniref:LapA family protein n=1 Tax=Shivajiella indica TaxID=872115 RepID=A0ABW5BEL8_9BACT
MDKKLFYIVYLFLFNLIGTVHGQDRKIEVEGYFQQDSAMLGERVAYVLKVQYGEGSNIIFPDSTYDFSPFVLLEKKTFMSNTSEGVTLDSAVYFVSNFSLDPISNFSLPVYEVFKYDSLVHRPLEVSLALKLIIDNIPDELSFKDNNIYQPIETEFNFPLMIAIILSFALIGLGILFFFGKKIKRRWEIWLEKRKYKLFALKWKKAEEEFAAHPDMNHADELLGLWKTYMEHLKAKPFREWTTIEISDFLENKDIIKDFREIEMVLYAGKAGNNIPKACQNLWNICSDTYQQKITATDERK